MKKWSSGVKKWFRRAKKWSRGRKVGLGAKNQKTVFFYRKTVNLTIFCVFLRFFQYTKKKGAKNQLEAEKRVPSAGLQFFGTPLCTVLFHTENGPKTAFLPVFFLTALFSCFWPKNAVFFTFFDYRGPPDSRDLLGVG